MKLLSIVISLVILNPLFAQEVNEEGNKSKFLKEDVEKIQKKYIFSAILEFSPINVNFNNGHTKYYYFKIGPDVSIKKHDIRFLLNYSIVTDNQLGSYDNNFGIALGYDYTFFEKIKNEVSNKIKGSIDYSENNNEYELTSFKDIRIGVKYYQNDTYFQFGYGLLLYPNNKLENYLSLSFGSQIF